MRKANLKRKTNETEIEIELNLDGEGNFEIGSGIKFFDHMIEQFSKHSGFDLNLVCKGDVEIDDHHSIEDMGIVIGQAINEALGEKLGINRYGFFILPMDEALTTVAIDLSGRYSFKLDCNFSREKVGDLSTELIFDFFDAIAQNLKCSLVIKQEFGRNDHHKIEGIFKAFARAMKMAVEIDERNKSKLPSTKGRL